MRSDDVVLVLDEDEWGVLEAADEGVIRVVDDEGRPRTDFPIGEFKTATAIVRRHPP